MASIIKVDTIQTAAGGTPTAADLGITGTGKVLQVVQGEYSTQVAFNTQTFTDCGPTATITPTSATSKILVMTSQSVDVYVNASTQRAVDMQILRDSTSIYRHNRAYIVRGATDGSYLEGHTMICFQYLDSPGDTSSHTYKAQGLNVYTSGTGELRFNLNNQKSTITLMEIAG